MTSTPHRQMYTSAIMVMTLTSDLENNPAVSTHVMNICGKFHWNSSTE